MSNFTKGSYVKIKSSVTKTEISDYGIKNLCGKDFVQRAFKIVNYVKSYYTERDYVVLVKGREYILPPTILELATEDEVRRASWFSDRALDITSHHKTKIFK